MKIPNPFKGRQKSGQQTPNNAPPGGNNQPPGQTPGNQSNQSNQSANGKPLLTRTTSEEKLALVNYSPEELIQQVDERIATIQFGWTKTIKWMEGWSEVWSWAGPVILLLGTIGEV